MLQVVQGLILYFLIKGIIETILIAMILLDMEIFSIWFILILIVVNAKLDSTIIAR